MPLPYDKQFRAEVVELARKRDTPIAQIAKDFGINETTIGTWMRKEVNPHIPASKSIDLLEEVKLLRKRNRLLEQENEVMRRAAAYLAQESLYPKKGFTR